MQEDLPVDFAYYICTLIYIVTPPPYNHSYLSYNIRGRSMIILFVFIMHLINGLEQTEQLACQFSSR